MLNVGTAELLVILLVALLVLGPTKLPDAARQVGRALAELRRLSSGFQAEMRDALREPVEGTPGHREAAAPARADGALSSPKASGDGAGEGSEPTAGSAAVAHAAPAGPDAEPGEDAGGDGGEDDAGAAGARAGRDSPATSPPAHEPGSNGSSPA